MPTQTKRRSQNKPQQARAQVTRDAILEATVRLFEKGNLDAATTTRIAEVAGVSIGTLYHYFADRDAIVDALQEREFARALDLMSSALSFERPADTPIEIVERVVRGLAQLYEACPGLHRVLTIEGLRVASADRVHAFDLRVIALIRTFLATRGAQLRSDDVETTAFVAYQSVRATMLACLLERPPGLDPERLVGQIVDLVVRYLVRDEPSVGART